MKIKLNLILCALLASCGGGGGGSSTPAITTTIPPLSPVGTAGVFDVDFTQFVGVYTLLDDGRFYGMHFGGSVLLGHPYGTLTKPNTLNTPERITWVNFVDDIKRFGGYEANPEFGRVFDGAGLTVGLTSPMGSFHAVARSQKFYETGSVKTMYAHPQPMSVLVGSYAGYLRTAGFGHAKDDTTSFSIDAAGKVTAHAADCDFKGSMQQYLTTGIFEVSMQSSGPACGYGGSLSGIVTPISYEGGVPRLGFQLDAADKEHSAVFIMVKL